MTAILQVMHDFADNSMTRIIEKIVHYLREEGFEFHAGVVTDQDMRSSALRDLGVRTVEFFQSRSIPDAIRDYIDANQISVVHSHSPRTAVMTYFALRRMAYHPHIQTRHLLARLNSRAFGAAFTAIDRVSLYMSDVIVPVSQTMGEEIKRFPALADKVHPIQNGVETHNFYKPEERTAARSELGIAEDETALIFTGRLEVMKRIDLIISAIEALKPDFPHLKLIVVGVGSLNEELTQQAANAALADRVLFLGFRTDIPRLLAAGDIYVQASTNEGLSLSILEAMSAGKIIVSTDVGAAREVLEHGKTGLIIPPLQLEALIEALRTVLTQPQYGAQLGQTARDVVNARFSARAMAHAYAQVYRDYLAR